MVKAKKNSRHPWLTKVAGKAGIAIKAWLMPTSLLIAIIGFSCHDQVAPKPTPTPKPPPPPKVRTLPEPLWSIAGSRKETNNRDNPYPYLFQYGALLIESNSYHFQNAITARHAESGKVSWIWSSWKHGGKESASSLSKTIPLLSNRGIVIGNYRSQNNPDKAPTDITTLYGINLNTGKTLWTQDVKDSLVSRLYGHEDSYYYLTLARGEKQQLHVMEGSASTGITQKVLSFTTLSATDKTDKQTYDQGGTPYVWRDAATGKIMLLVGATAANLVEKSASDKEDPSTTKRITYLDQPYLILANLTEKKIVYQKAVGKAGAEEKTGLRPPQVVGDKAVFTKGKTLIVAQLATGNTVWSKDFLNDMREVAIHTDGADDLYVLPQGEVLHCLSLNGGNTVWKTSISHSVHDNLSFYKDKMLYFVSGSGGSIFAMNTARSGSYAWILRKTTSPFVGRVIVSDGKLYVKNSNATLCYSIDDIRYY